MEGLYLFPVPAEHKLELVTGGESGGDLRGAFNLNVKRLDELSKRAPGLHDGETQVDGRRTKPAPGALRASFVPPLVRRTSLVEPSP